MSKISGQNISSQREDLPWDAQASVEVRGLPGAISAQMAQKPVSNDVAPMMSELLARLDSVVEGAPRHLVAPPPLAGLAETPSLRESVRSEEHTSELQSRPHPVCRLLLERTTPPSRATRVAAR